MLITKYILCVPLYQITLDGLPEELFGGGHEGAGEEDGGGDLVEAFEGPVVDGDLVDLEEELGSGGDRPQHLRHPRRSLELHICNRAFNEPSRSYIVPREGPY